ncbi:MAG: quinohemoprotein ethanol dehydrogenase, partial [Actinomycetota bacterium]|nr:quinohemoprotein ethanol dehydrogenase [Actinomycetota bacterium]
MGAVSDVVGAPLRPLAPGVARDPAACGRSRHPRQGSNDVSDERHEPQTLQSQKARVMGATPGIGRSIALRRSPRDRFGAMVLAVAIAVALAACGGGGNKNAATTVATKPPIHWSLPNVNLSNTRVANSTISASNVGKLGVAWTMPLTGVSAFGSFSSNPVVGNGVAYLQDLKSN